MPEVLSFAVEELDRYYEKLTGKKCTQISIIEDASILREGEDAYFVEEYSVQVEEGRGEIRGSNGRSVLMGVYRFLRELGCVFFHPGKGGEVIPKREEKDCTVRLTHRPFYPFRAITMEGGTSVETVLNLIDWSLKNGFNSYFTQFRDSHTFFERYYNQERNPFQENQKLTPEQSAGYVKRIVAALKQRGMLYHAVGHGWHCETLGLPAKGWHKVMPEDIPPVIKPYLSELKGERRLYLNTPVYSQFCYSNKVLLELVTDEVVNYAKNNPEVDYLHFWLGDNYNNFCECEKCREKRPSDWYIDILNRIDEKMTAAGIKTKIVFLIYYELLWPAEKERLKNPDRFVLMFAPITREYTSTWLGDSDDWQSGEVPEFKLNEVSFPTSPKENLAFLLAHKQYFKGEGFVFDYHLMWEPFKDLSGMMLAPVVHGDMLDLKKMGMQGYVSCQMQKAFMPHGFAQYVMGHTLENPDEPYEKMYEDFHTAAFGDCKDEAIAALTVIKNSGVDAYLRYNQEQLPCKKRKSKSGCHLVDAQGELEKYIDSLSARVNDMQGPQKTSVFRLSLYLRLVSLYFDVIRTRCKCGSKEEIDAKRRQMTEFLFRHEGDFGSSLDAFYFDEMAEAIMAGTWQAVLHEDDHQ